MINGCRIPDELDYDVENGIWVSRGDEIVTIGLTDVHQSMAGKLTSVRTKPVGSDILQGRSLGTIESIKYVGKVVSPFDGRVEAINESLSMDPSLVNKDPYGAGWIIKLRSDSREATNILSGQLAVSAFKKKISELRVTCFEIPPDKFLNTLGLVCPGPVTRLGEEVGIMNRGEVIHMVADDPAAELDVISWAKVTGQEIVELRKGEANNILHFLVRKAK
ncbi:MAG: sulfurtransferase TusA family protein [Nitrososphaerales archaeon]